MRFRFCWDCDCPDWILAEISNISKFLPSLAKEVTLHIVEDSCGRTKLNFDYLHSLVTSQCTLDLKTMRATVAAIRWILFNASGADVEPKVLRSELEQLGLKKENSIVISEVYDSEKENLQNSLKIKTLQASENVLFGYETKEVQFGEDSFSYCVIGFQGKLLEQEYGYFTEPCLVKKETEKEENGETVKMVIADTQLDGLLNEMEEALKNMEELGK